MLKTILTTFFISMVPVLELRGAIPYGVAGGIPVFYSALIAIVGNMVPVPFVLLFARTILSYMEQRNQFLKGLAAKLRAKAERNRKKVERYKFWGLVLLVAIPLPGTGAWTGTLAASFLDMDFKKSCAAAMCGVVLAGIIMGIISFAVKGALT
jgi:uncharacterized membrane protein